VNLHAIRHRAEKLLRDCRETSAPIRVERIAKALKLEVLQMELGPEIAGMLVSDGAASRICVRKADARVRRRFTIAHEIGHFYLGHKFSGDQRVHVDRGHVIRFRSPKSSTGEDLMEVEANQFAASLLMPERLVREQVELQGGAPVSDIAVTSLANDFDVSEQSMTIRLTVLGLL
jgi:Zn-dependent peptidase ImmA (M78 family)